MKMHSIRFRMAAWYATLLAGGLLLFCAATYLGLERYLKTSLDEELTTEARTIAETVLDKAEKNGDAYVVSEISEDFAPEINNRLIRVSRYDGSYVFRSGVPNDHSFDPAHVPPASGVNQESTRKIQLVSGRRLLVHYVSYVAPQGTRFLVEVGVSYSQIGRALEGLLATFAIGLPFIVAGATAGGYLLMRRALRPVDDIRQKAEQITSSNLSERLPVVHTGDELERLARALNSMIERLEQSFQHINRFTADASHELRTPLTVLQGELEAMAALGHKLPGEVRETIGSALEETQRLARIVESLLVISRLNAGEALMQRVRLDLADLARTTADQMRLLAEEKRITLHSGEAVPVEVEGDASRLKQVVVNLLDNAIKYTPGGGSVAISVAQCDGHAVLEVADTGLGIAAEDLPHVFDRFYRTDKARTRQQGGVGLGLSIVRSICSAHGGQVTVSSVEGKGSRFRVELPLANGTAARN